MEEEQKHFLYSALLILGVVGFVIWIAITF